MTLKVPADPYRTPSPESRNLGKSLRQVQRREQEEAAMAPSQTSWPQPGTIWHHYKTRQDVRVLVVALDVSHSVPHHVVVYQAGEKGPIEVLRITSFLREIAPGITTYRRSHALESSEPVADASPAPPSRPAPVPQSEPVAVTEEPHAREVDRAAGS